MATKTPDTATPLPLIANELFSRDASDQREEIPRLVSALGAMQAEASHRIEQTIVQFATDPDLLVDDRAPGSPSQVVLRLFQPDGEPVARVRVQITGARTDAKDPTQPDQPLALQGLQALQPLRDGSVVARLPSEWRRRLLKELVVAITGGGGTQTVAVPIGPSSVDGDVLPVTLSRRSDPLPLAVFEGLSDLAAMAGDDPAASAPSAPVRPRVSIGQDECNLVFRNDPSEDRFSYSLLFRLTDPGMSLPTVARPVPPADSEGRTDLRAVFPDTFGSPPRLAGLQLVDRVAIDRPVSVEAFGRAVSGIDTPRRLPLASTLAIGYVVTLAQRWTQKGLALGDLVYSLPLAPGEQQRIVVVERTQSQGVMEREVLEQREDLRFDETDTSSVQATVANAFQEAAQGGSQYQADSSSFSVAAAAGGGGVWPFGAFAGGVATSYGSASASGSTSTWMSGARQATSNAAQTTQAAVSRRASAARSASRASVRLATSSETTEVTTKAITNHNRTRALTMQYWEVLRLFDVATVVEDVSLVCMVPLDIVDFLPAGEPAQLATSTLGDRAAVLERYARLLRHSDVLMRRVPWRLRRGLQALNDFAADPRATVQAPGGAALTQVVVTVRGGFTLLDRPQVQLLLRNGIRTAALPLAGTSSGNDGLSALKTGTEAHASEAELFTELRRRRGLVATVSATITLPPSVALQDVTGVLVSNGLTRLDYTFAPAGIGLAQSLLGSSPTQLATVLAGLAVQVPVSRSYGADRVSRELGDLTLTEVRAVVGALTVANGVWSTGTPVSGPGLTVSAQRLAPELSYDSVLEIERTLQWVLRNTMACSLAVVAAMTPEERTVMLERYSVTPPMIDKNGRITEGVPLLSCVTNKVLGFYGNSIVMPFQIPFALAQRLKVDSGRIQRALRRFHTEAFDHPVATVSLPTRGVLGEAVLGNCPSAEKIDLTRFWNWQDSPIEEAPDIGAVSVPTDNRLGNLEAPSKLTGLTPIINNFSTQGPGSADSSLATALAGKLVEFSKPFDAGVLTNAGNLKEVLNKTTDTAEAARKDALGAAKDLAIKAMEVSAAMKKAQIDADAKKPDPKGEAKPETPAGGGSGPTAPATPTPPAPVVPPAAPAARPAKLHVFFNLDKTDLVDATAEGRSGQNQRIADFIVQARAFKATAVLVRGFASPEGTEARNFELVADRARVLADKLRAELPGVTVTTAIGGVISGPPSAQFPELRRAGAEVTAP